MDISELSPENVHRPPFQYQHQFQIGQSRASSNCYHTIAVFSGILRRIKVFRNRNNIIRQDLWAGIDSVHAKCVNFLSVIVKSDNIVTITIPDHCVWANDIRLSIVSQDSVFIHIVVERPAKSGALFNYGIRSAIYKHCFDGKTRT